MTGYRLGYVVTPSAATASVLRVVQEASIISPAMPVQYAGLAALGAQSAVARHRDHVALARGAALPGLVSAGSACAAATAPSCAAATAPSSSPLSAPWPASQGLTLTDLFRNPGRADLLYRIAETLTDISQEYWHWRLVHLQTAERMLGRGTRGTGGTGGVAYLTGKLEAKPFQELWAATKTSWPCSR